MTLTMKKMILAVDGTDLCVVCVSYQLYLFSQTILGLDLLGGHQVYIVP